MKALLARKAPQGPGLGTAGAKLHHRLQVLFDHVGGSPGIDREESVPIQLDSGVEEVALQAVEHHARIDRLASFHAGNDPDDRIVKRAGRGHEGPPPRLPEARRTGP